MGSEHTELPPQPAMLLIQQKLEIMQMFIDEGMHKILGDLLGSILDSSENHTNQLFTSTQ